MHGSRATASAAIPAPEMAAAAVVLVAALADVAAAPECEDRRFIAICGIAALIRSVDSIKSER